jgi:thiopeptide-type bacteriocin biosynthesis protein
LAEHLFHENSVAVARCLDAIQHAPDKEDRRWRAAFVAAFDKICTGLGDLHEARRFCNAMRLGYRAEFGENDGTSRAVSDNYRRHGKDLLPLVTGARGEHEPAAAPRLSAGERALLAGMKAMLPADRFELALQSLVHMDCNRIFAFHARANEMVVYEYMERFVRSLIARGFGLSTDGALVNQSDHKAGTAA